ncbi:3'-5' exonuclease family protein [Anthocerotibacter panamensis]|uniref:hypothetical protein n=1 Tax=Anthocerotibacter panamensis TaxID=2857077 RepID=UPI001C407781|nr:hypothetical protein [Anthocerotibacter panamensis]
MLPYHLITSAEQLQDLLPRWRAAQILALDIEVAHAHQMRNRKQTVSLMQIWDGQSDHIWLLDALAVDTKPFIEEIMASKSVTKIFHDALHDLHTMKCVRRAQSVVCTLAMAKERLQPRCSLKALSANLLDLEIDKQYQMSNWATRPLSPEQLHYAALDAWVTYHVWCKLSQIPIPNPGIPVDPVPTSR